MKKLTAGIFTVLIGLCAANSADAAIASKAWVEQYAVSGDTYTEDKSTLESSIAAAKDAGDDAAAALGAYKTTNDAAVQANADAISAINNETTGILKQAKDYTDALANGAVKTNTENIATINEQLKSVATSDSLATLTSTVEGHTTAINTLNGDANTAGSVSKSIADAVTALKNGEIKANADAIDALEGLVGNTSVDSQIDTKIDALNLETTYQTIDAMAKKDETVASDAQDSVYPTVARTQDMIGNSITSQIVNGYVGAIGGLEIDGAETIVDAINKVNAEVDQKATDISTLTQTVADNKTAAENADKAINEKIGTVAEGKTVVQMIEAAQAAATYDDTAVKADIAANTTAINEEVTRAKAAEAANATAAANAKSAADAAQTQADKGVADAAAAKAVADAAIPAPTANCTDLGAKCVLTVGTAGYAWELVERADNE